MLRFCDLFTDNKFKYFKDLPKLNYEYLLDFSLVIFFKLRAAMMFFLHSRKNSVDINAISILSFFNTFKKGSKIILRLGTQTWLLAFIIFVSYRYQILMR